MMYFTAGNYGRGSWHIGDPTPPFRSARTVELTVDGDELELIVAAMSRSFWDKLPPPPPQAPAAGEEPPEDSIKGLLTAILRELKAMRRDHAAPAYLHEVKR